MNSLKPKLAAFLHNKKCMKITAGVLVATILVSGFAVFVNTNGVYVYDDGHENFVLTMKNDTRSILQEAGIETSVYDKVSFTGFESKQGTIVIDRAFPMTVTADGETTEVFLAEGTVADALAEADIALGEHDMINYELGEPLAENMEIVVKRVTYKSYTKTESIPFETERRYTPQFARSYSKLITAGVAGVKEYACTDKLIDGEVVETTTDSEKMVSAPVAETYLVGSAPKTPVSVLEPPANLTLNDSGKPTSYKRMFTATAVAYSAPPGAGTASGRKAIPGHIAVNPNVIPYGTKMYITTPDNKVVYGYAVAADTGTALMQGIVDVDLFYPSYESSCQFGKRTVEIYILD